MKLKIVFTYNEEHEEEVVSSKKQFMDLFKEEDFFYPTPEQFIEWCKNRKDCGITELFGYSVYDIADSLGILLSMSLECIDEHIEELWESFKGLQVNAMRIMDEDWYVVRLE